MTFSGRNDPLNDPEAARQMLLRMSVVSFVIMVLISVAGVRWTGAVLPALSGGSVPRMLLWGVALAIPLLGMLTVIRHARWSWIRDLWIQPAGLIGPAVSRMTRLELALIALSAGVGEELLFRGFLQHWLLVTGIVPAILLPSMLFGLLHWLSPAYAATVFLVGLYLACLIALVPGVSLGALMVAHTLYDLIALVLLRDTIRKGGTGCGTPEL